MGDAVTWQERKERHEGDRGSDGRYKARNESTQTISPLHLNKVGTKGLTSEELLIHFKTLKVQHNTYKNRVLLSLCVTFKKIFHQPVNG